MSLKGFFIRDGKKPSPGTKPLPAVEEPKQEPSEGPASESVSIFDSILHNKEIVTKIETAYGEFEFKYPGGEDMIAVAHRRALYLGGFPDSAYDNARRIQFEQWATLDILVIKKPDRFKDLTTWANCPDPELTEALYNKGAQFCQDVRKQIDEDRPGGSQPSN